MAPTANRANLPRHALAAAAGAIAAIIGSGLTIGFNVAIPQSIAAPPADSQGYIDSTARCAAPATVVVFGSTDSSRVAICAAASGAYQYRGVRVRDGAKLVLAAKSNGAGGYVAVNNGITYTVTPAALIVSDGTGVIRKETMLDFHGSGTTGSGASAPNSSAPAATTPKPPPGQLAPTTAVTATTPPPPPLPAEVGGATGH
jgi:hypothetical protein